MLPWRSGFAIACSASSRKARSRPVLRIERIEATERALIRIAALAGRLQPRLAVGLLQGQDAQAGSEALLGVGPVGHDRLEQRGGGRADLFGDGDHPRRRPGAVAAMGAGHVIGDAWCGRAGSGDLAWLATRSPLWKISTVLSATRTSTSSRISRIGHRIPAAVDLDVVVGRDAAALPDGEGVGFAAGSGLNAGASMVANSSARLASKPFIRRALMSRTRSPIAALRSAALKKR